MEPTVELYLDDQWVDITTDVRSEPGIIISRGLADEAAQAAPSTCTLTVNNRDGKYSPRNPMSPYYGLLGRNTPLRVSVAAGGRRLTATAGGVVTTPDSAGLSVGDIDVRFDARIANWANDTNLIWKADVVGQRSWWLYPFDATLVFEWSADGSTTLFAQSTVPMPALTGRQAVRATLDVDNGAGGHTVTFYTAPNAAGPWVQLGDPITASGTTSIFDSTATANVGTYPTWEVYSAEVRDGINGTVVASPDFTAPAEGATSFNDAQGNTWTVPGTSTITNRRFRFHGEVSAWPVKWDTSGNDVATTITASGILRRLAQGAKPFQSALRRALPSETGIVAYWPMEDGNDATSLASALPGAPAMSISGPSAPSLASDDQIKGSLPLPVMNGAVFAAGVPAAPAGTILARCVIAIPAAGDTNLGEIMRIPTTGTNVVAWVVYYATGSGGTIFYYGEDSDGNVVAGPGFTHTNANGRKFLVSLQITTSGSDVARSLTTVDLDDDSGLVSSNTTASATVGRATAVYVNGDPAAPLMETVIGHVHILSSVSANPYKFEDYARGWVPETPGRRVERVCSEENVPFTGLGYLGPTSPASAAALEGFQGMGPQAAEEFLTIVSKAVDVDLGLLIEPRESLGLAYRPRETRYNQHPALALDYEHLYGLTPVEDDQTTRNDITATRDGASSARAVLEAGPLSVQTPPDGIGVYDEQVDLNIQLDSALSDQANWRLHLGTVDEARYPVVRFGLETPGFAADPELTGAALDLDQGDLLVIENPPAWLPPGDIEQIALGFRETITPYRYEIEVNCAPASPWRVGVLDDPELGRLDSDASSLDSAVDEDDTSIDVAVEAGHALWVTTADNPGEFPFDIAVGGEVMTVTAVSGSSSPQTFTVVRSVNGVVKSHSAGAQIHLAKPVYIAL